MRAKACTPLRAAIQTHAHLRAFPESRVPPYLNLTVHAGQTVRVIDGKQEGSLKWIKVESTSRMCGWIEEKKLRVLDDGSRTHTPSARADTSHMRGMLRDLPPKTSRAPPRYMDVEHSDGAIRSLPASVAPEVATRGLEPILAATHRALPPPRTMLTHLFNNAER